MARWRGAAAFVICTRKYKAGQTYADTVGNALAGDVVYAPFGSASGLSPMLVPLDGAATTDPPPLKWSDLRYVFDIKEDCNGKEAIQA